MTDHPSLLTRIAVGKAIGFGFGLVGYLTLPMLLPDADPYLRWGILLWYGTMGAMIGVVGVITWHPLLNLPLHLVAARASARRLAQFRARLFCP